MPSSDHVRRILDELQRRGATDVRYVKGRKHPHFEFTVRGRKRKYYTSLSPSDYRATAKAIADIRRMLKESK